MNEAIRQRQVLYPIIDMPDDTYVYEVVRHIRDIKLCITLPNATPVHGRENEEAFKITLRSLGADAAVFRVVSIFNKDTELLVSVPVLSDMNDIPKEVSYVIVDTGDIQGIDGLDLRVHPDCIFFSQMAPLLRYTTRENVTTDGAGVSETRAFGSTVKVCDGYNVSVSGTAASIVFSGGSKQGLGMYTESPWLDKGIEDITARQSRGLRTINGFTSDVLITGDSSVLVEGGTDAIELSVNVKPGM